MTEIFRFRGWTVIIRQNNPDDGFASVTRLTRNGGERRVALRPDVVRIIGTKIEANHPQPLPPPVRHRDNGQLVR